MASYIFHEPSLTPKGAFGDILKEVLNDKTISKLLIVDANCINKPENPIATFNISCIDEAREIAFQLRNLTVTFHSTCQDSKDLLALLYSD